MTDAEPAKLVDEKGVAKSPFSQYPGEIRFPVPFRGHLYRAVTEALVAHDEDFQGDIFDLLPYWRVVTAVAEIEVEGVDPAAGFDAQDVDILRWARDAAVEYTDRFLTPIRSRFKPGKA